MSSTPTLARKRILVYGGTGPAGIAMIERLLAGGHVVLVYARTPSKLPNSIQSHHDAHIIEGSLVDDNSLKRPFELTTKDGERKQIDAILSALGPPVIKGPFHPAGCPIAAGYRKIVDLARSYGVKRILILGTTSISDEHDQKSLTFWALVNGVHVFATTAYNDIIACGEAVRATGDELEWTIVRVPVLTNKENKEYVAGYVGDGKTTPWLTRRAFAEFMVDELQAGLWIRKQPLVSLPH